MMIVKAVADYIVKAVPRIPRWLQRRWKLHSPAPSAKPNLQLNYRAINLNQLKAS